MQVTVDGKKVKTKKGESVLELLKRLGKDVPYLCYDKELKHVSASCRLCLVEINGRVNTSCNTKVRKDMVIKSKTKQLEDLRKISLKFLLESNQAKDYEESKMKELLKRYGVKKGFDLGLSGKYKKIRNVSLHISENKCILCANCEDVCDNLQEVHAFRMEHDGIKTKLLYDEDMCVYCGQCVLHCPTAAIMENNEIEKFLKTKKKAKKSGMTLIAQIAPSVRASIGESFGYPPGKNVVGKVVTALRKLGFDKVFDVNLGADLTTTEEGNEFLARLNKKKDSPLPMFTSCCPSWVKFVEEYYPDLIPHLSSAKSPHMMLAKVIKMYYAKKIGIHPSKIFLVSIMPCTSKKFEISRREFGGKDGGVKYMDVDLVLTTRELARAIKRKKINFRKLKNSNFDQPLGLASGGGAIFGVTGGVMESSLRVVWKEACQRKILFKEVRGQKRTRDAKLKICGRNLRIAVVHTLSEAKDVLDQIRNSKRDKKKSKYDFIEVMACPGGCIGGGGQPIPSPQEIVMQRGNALYKIDDKKKYRISTENPALKTVYDEFLGEPLSKKAEKLLHTTYVKRKI